MEIHCVPLSFVVVAIISFSIMATKKKTFTLYIYIIIILFVPCHRRCQGEGLLFQDPNLGEGFLYAAKAFLPIQRIRPHDRYPDDGYCY